MKRPDTPQFWMLSDILIEQDSIAETDGLVAAVGEIIDLETLAYVAQQRAFRALNVYTAEQALAHQEEVAKLAAIWMDAFVTGAKYGKRQRRKTDAD
jgi:hypothetical protein